MTCNAPLDITQSVASKCEQKCRFHFNYGNSGCTIVNNGDHLSVSYDGTSDVVFNSQKYTATELLMFKPSLHTFNGKRAAAEVLLRHKNGTNELFVCIPITLIGAPSTGSILLSQIINNAQTKDNANTISVPDFNANFLIPSSPYYTYTGSLLYGDCSDQEYNYIVFHPRNGFISLQAEDLRHLGNIIEVTDIPNLKGDLFFNAVGTKSNGFSGDGELYMSCQPTGASEEEIIFKESTSSSSSDTTQKAIKGLLSFFLILCLFYLAKYMVSYISKNKNQSISSNGPTAVSPKTP